MSERLWAPWRLEYIRSADKQQGCIFCLKPAESQDEQNLILYRGKKAFILLNRFPYTTGHLMVALYRHTDDLGEFEVEEQVELLQLTHLSLRLLEKVYQPQGYNVGVNLGRAAGAGIVGHFHLHVVPRWVGDTNFMPVLGEVRVIPENLEDTYRKLRAALEEENGGGASG